jgi:transcriptional regulator with XRE-family HTH domain
VAKALTGLNPIVLQWARERAGYSLGNIALILKKDVGTIKGWESGVGSPSYGQLEKLAYQYYKRPLAFYPKTGG